MHYFNAILHMQESMYYSCIYRKTPEVATTSGVKGHIRANVCPLSFWDYDSVLCIVCQYAK